MPLAAPRYTRPHITVAPTTDRGLNTRSHTRPCTWRPPLAASGLALLTALLMAHLPAWSQSACSSDGQPLRSAMVERFLSADCERCWTTAPSLPPPLHALELDWVLPGSLGDEAPLSAVARRDGLARQQRLQTTERQTSPATTHAQPSTADPTLALPPRLSIVKNNSNKLIKSMRLAHGLPYNDYMAASLQVPTGIAMARGGQAWLVLLEALPAGTEGSPVARYLVRNSLVLDLPQTPWAHPLTETRPLWIPQGTQPERLRVAGWIETRQGQLLMATQTQCAQPE